MRWEIVKVHFEGDTQKWRAVCYNEKNVVIHEKTFHFFLAAEDYIKEQNESIWIFKRN